MEEGLSIFAYVMMGLGGVLVAVLIIFLIIWMAATRCGQKNWRSSKTTMLRPPPPYYYPEKHGIARMNGPGPYIRAVNGNIKPGHENSRQQVIMLDKRQVNYSNPQHGKAYQTTGGARVASGPTISYETRPREELVATGRGRSRSVSELYPLRLRYGEDGRYYTPHSEYYRRADSDKFPITRKAYSVEPTRKVYQPIQVEHTRLHESPFPVRRANPPVYVLERQNMASRPVYLPPARGPQIYYITPRQRHEEEVRAKRTEEYVRSTLGPPGKPATISKITTDRWASVEPYSLETSRGPHSSRSGAMNEQALVLRWDPEWVDKNIKYGIKASSVC